MIKIENQRKTINDEIQYMIDNTIQQQAQPELVTITKIYNDNHVDCLTEHDEKLEYIAVIGKTLQVNDKGILFLLSNDQYYIIA